MNKKYLIVNTGSASKKYALYEGGTQSAFLHLETENGGFVSTLTHEKGMEKSKISAEEFKNSLEYLVSVFTEKNYITSLKDIFGVGIRIVAPGIYFTENRFIDAEFLKHIEKAGKMAPLHIEAISSEIKALKAFFGDKLPMFGVSDSVFHKDMPERSKYYAIPLDDAKKFDIFRYGYHGISMQSIVKKLSNRGQLPSKMIVCHIGGGVSITAIKDGKSVDTTMGFTPLEGMVMSTRVGDIDSGALIYLSECLGISGTELRQYLNKKSGLLGLSGGLSDDVRDLLVAEEEGNKEAKNALDIYSYRIQKQIGAYKVTLGGLDAIIFAGTVGERSFKMRKRICDGLEVLGARMDKHRSGMVDDFDSVISAHDSRVKIQIIKTDEMKIIAEKTREVIK
jgi:acetate kinase